MKVIWFNGNFGNQIFYCAYKDYLRSKYPQERVYSYIDPKCPPVKVEERTNLSLPENSFLINVISFFVFKVIGVLFRRIPLKCVPKWYCESGELKDFATFNGHYLQVKSYYENRPSNWLDIKEPESPDDDYVRWKNLISNNSSVCVHLRRGDYVKPGSAYADLSSTDYYQKAMEYAKSIMPDAKFFFFSDDLDYVKGLFKGDNIFYVDCNKDNNGYLDIKLMSLAKVNIIANSTFSYWAAYINHEKKKVIYPQVWFDVRTGRKAPDIMLDSWIGI